MAATGNNGQICNMIVHLSIISQKNLFLFIYQNIIVIFGSTL